VGARGGESIAKISIVGRRLAAQTDDRQAWEVTDSAGMTSTVFLSHVGDDWWSVSVNGLATGQRAPSAQGALRLAEQFICGGE
jgi:hypothetical protein